MYIFAQTMKAFEDLNVKNKSTAVTEIVIMLIGAFLLGYLLHWLICRARHGADATARRDAPRAVRLQSAQTRPKRADDLTIIEGIGPKVADILNTAGITTFSDLAGTSAAAIKDVLNKAGPRFRVHDPSSWPKQAVLARDGDMDALEALQKRLTAGRR